MSTLVVVGDLVEDVVVWLGGPLEYATDTPARVLRARGGSAANVAAFAAGLEDGVAVRFIGCVGADPLGERLTAELSAAGVEVSVQRRGRTGTVVVLVDRGGERTMLPDRAAAGLLADVPSAWLPDTGILHVPAYGLLGEPGAQAVRDLLDRAAVRQREVGGPGGVDISLDASSVSVLRSLGAEHFLDLVARLLPRVLFANADEARFLRLPERLPPLGPRGLLVIKDGPRPTTLVDGRGRSLTVPVPPCHDDRPVRDATGAGDAFAAGFLTALLTGADPPRCAERGHALARRVLSVPGAALQAEHPGHLDHSEHSEHSEHPEPSERLESETR